MNSSLTNPILEPSRQCWPFQRHSAAWLPNLLLCLLGFLPLARGQDPIIDLNYPMDTNASLGATVSFRVYANTSYPPLSYQWMHEGNILPGATSPTLVLANLTIADAGGYVAWVTNAGGGFTNSRTATLTVDPTFTKIMTGVIVTDSEGSISGNWADYDNDGYPDMFVANSAPSGSTRNTLYHNNGGTGFSRVAASPFTTDFMRVWGAAWADYNNDGNVDLVAANLDGGTLAQRLYRNNGDGSFTAVVDSALRSDTAAATGPWWFDYDNDGFLDLFVTKGIPYGGSAANDCLFRNNGDGTFKKMTAAEVGPILNDQLGTEFCFSVDYDNDGRQELTVAHTISVGGGIYDPNELTWRFQANGTFVSPPIGIPAGAITWADYDNDGWLDTFSNIGGQPNIFRNLAAGGFADATASLNVTTMMQPFIPTWGDYDNDGWLDVFFTSFGNLNGLFHNNRDGTFTQILTGSPVYDADRRVAPTWSDIDNDGFLDLFIAVGDAQPQRNRLYRNNGNGNHWLKVKLDGRVSNRSGIGAKVRAQATINGQMFWQMREISCGSAYGGQNGLFAHFGLGDATNVTTLRIEWPSGIVQELQNVTTNQFLTVVESQSYTNVAPQFSGVTNNAGGLQLSFTEPAANARYLLEASSDLVNWTKLMAHTSTGVTTNYTDTGATNYTRRFYRLQVP